MSDVSELGLQSEPSGAISPQRFKSLISGLTEPERMDASVEGVRLGLPTLQRYESFMCALARLDQAVGVTEVAEKNDLVRSALAVLPDAFGIDQFFFSQLSAEEIKRVTVGFALAVEHAELALRSSGVEVEFAFEWTGKPPLCRRKLAAGILERIGPFLNAKVGLARCLWLGGDCVGAVQHLWDVLRLDPADHRWVRFPLASWLFQMEDERALKHLIRICFRVTDQIGPWTINSINGEHVEHCTFFFYLQALMAFRRYGPRTNRRSGLNRFETSLYEGLCENRLAAQFLLGRVPLPEVRVRKIYSDPLLEAIHCAQHSLELWQSVPGALKCLAEVFDRREHGLSRAIVRKTR